MLRHELEHEAQQWNDDRSVNRVWKSLGFVVLVSVIEFVVQCEGLSKHLFPSSMRLQIPTLFCVMFFGISLRVNNGYVSGLGLRARRMVPEAVSGAA